jgi:hypothetical protein
MRRNTARAAAGADSGRDRGAKVLLLMSSGSVF